LCTYRQGINFRLWLNNGGVIGRYAWYDSPPNGGFDDMESQIEMLFGAGIWVGAIVDTSRTIVPMRAKLVSTSFEGWSGPPELFGNPDGRDTFFITNRFQPDRRNRVAFDDDGDGKVDEDEFDAIDNDHDGGIDEDFGAVSENDAYVAYYDTNGNPNPVPGHIPLGIKIWQRSYAWGSGKLRIPVIPFEFNVINVSERRLDSVHIGVLMDPDIGPPRTNDYFAHNLSGFEGNLRLAYGINPLDKPIASLGCVFLGASTSLDPVASSFTGQYPRDGNDTTDSKRYECMSHGKVLEGSAVPHDTRLLLSVGSLGSLLPGDTLSVTAAIVRGSGLQFVPDNLFDNVVACRALYRRDFSLPPAPPSPRLHVKTEGTTVKLDWSREPDDVWPDPEDSWDNLDPALVSLPGDHWRKRNPPAPGAPGGRNFEGFRVYRSAGPKYDEQTFTLVAQYDMDDDLGYGPGTGLSYTFVDSGLSPHTTYWYAVTSYSVPAVDVQTWRGPSGDVVFDTVASILESESDLSMNATAAIIRPSYRLYACYPNPFNPSTNVSFEIPERTYLTLRVFDILGREVAVLADGPFAPGRYDIPWDASGQSAGVYFCRIESAGFTSTTKLVLLK
jgi:hypothetical protein